ncbi:hypothetical protein [Enterococcus malodoratus]
MEITIKATPEELAKMLQAIASSQEQRLNDQNIENISSALGSDTKLALEF